MVPMDLVWIMSFISWLLRELKLQLRLELRCCLGILREWQTIDFAAVSSWNKCELKCRHTGWGWGLGFATADAWIIIERRTTHILTQCPRRTAGRPDVRWRPMDVVVHPGRWPVPPLQPPFQPYTRASGGRGRWAAQWCADRAAPADPVWPAPRYPSGPPASWACVSPPAPVYLTAMVHQSAHPAEAAGAGGAVECVARCRRLRGSVSSRSWRDCVVLHNQQQASSLRLKRKSSVSYLV